jgi:hypothetical protein
MIIENLQKDFSPGGGGAEGGYLASFSLSLFYPEKNVKSR